MRSAAVTTVPSPPPSQYPDEATEVFNLKYGKVVDDYNDFTLIGFNFACHMFVFSSVRAHHLTRTPVLTQVTVG